MICFLESGRLGNQLFQYAALRTIAKTEERLILFGFADLRATFDGLVGTIVFEPPGVLSRLATRFRPQIDNFMKYQPLINVISERHDESGTHVETSRRLIGNIQYVEMSYFQSESIFDERVVESLTLKTQLSVKALQRSASLAAFGRKRIFVHVRRGDHLRWPSAHFPAVLPAVWYKKCIETLRARLGDPVFVFVTDDVYYVRDVFGDMADACISETGPADDFALMCQCDGGILSASSFAWWASYFLKKRLPGAVCLAPEYWAGHRSHEWHPPNINARFLETVSV